MARSREELEQMNVTAPELEAAMEQHPFPEMPTTDLLQTRHARAQRLAGLRHLMPVPGPMPDQVSEKETFVIARDGHQIRIVVYTPVHADSQPGPLIVLFHEGGWMMGDLTDEEFDARLFSRDLGATCVNVEYRLAPEHPFPAGTNDCWDVVQWAASNASPSSSILPADPSKGFIVGGSSAGGGISAIMAHLSRNNDLQPPVTGQWLSVPYTMEPSQVPEKYMSQFISPVENDHDPILSHIDVNEGSIIYQVVQPDTSSPLFSTMAAGNYPNEASKPPMAKAFLQVAGLDPLRDHGLIYAQILEEEYDAEVRVEVYPGFSHMFWTNWPMMEMSRKFQQDTLRGLRWLLNM